MLKEILARPTYAGLVARRSGILMGEHSAIIAMDLWKRRTSAPDSVASSPP